jgi:hypothetical protein
MAIATLENCKQGCIALIRPLDWETDGVSSGFADGGWAARMSSTPPSSPSRRWNDPANYAPAVVATRSPGGVQFSPARKAAFNPSRQHGYTELPAGIGWSEIGGDLSRWGALNLPNYASVIEHKASGCLVVRCPLPPDALAAAHANMRDPSASTSAFIGGFLTSLVASPPLAVRSLLSLCVCLTCIWLLRSLMHEADALGSHAATKPMIEHCSDMLLCLRSARRCV